MRSTRRVSLVLLLSGFAFVGCSDGVETPAKAESRDFATAKPVTTASKSSMATPLDGKDASVKGTPAIAGTFADGEAAYRARKYSDATAIFEHHVSERPQHALGHYMLGLSAWKGNDLTKAEKAFDAALALDPMHLKSLVNVSRVFIDQKRYDDAVARLTRASEVEPGSNEVHRLLGRAYYSQGKTDAAIDAYQRAIELDDRDVWSMNNLGLLFLEQQRAEEAVPLLEKSVALRKDVPAFYNNLGMALEHLGRLDEAMSAYAAALAVDPSYDRSKQNLARLEAVIGHC
jgi:tetratricopeptide (TPR) repeat protein